MRPSSMSRIIKFQLLVGLLAATAALAYPTFVFASEASTIIQRCTHGQSLTGFRQPAYRKALRDLSTEVSEYSDCEELIRKAQLAGTVGRPGAGPGAGGGANSAGPATPVTPISVTPTEQRVISRAQHVGSHPLTVGDKTITPGVMHANISSAVSSLPSALLALLLFLLVGTLALLTRTITDYVRTRRRA